MIPEDEVRLRHRLDAASQYFKASCGRRSTPGRESRHGASCSVATSKGRPGTVRGTRARSSMAEEEVTKSSSCHYVWLVIFKQACPRKAASEWRRPGVLTHLTPVGAEVDGPPD